jgi:hypothetical protein
MAVAAARLYRITGEEKYLAEGRQITSDFVRRDAFLRPGNLFVNERDGWTDGFWAPAFADEVLTLPDVDSTGQWKSALRGTALSIISQRTPDGFYGADWSGPELNTNDRSMTWIEQAARSSGSGGGMALPGQIMTSSTSATMVLAAEIAGARSHPDAAAISPGAAAQYFAGRFSSPDRDEFAILCGNKFYYQTRGITSTPSQIAVITFGDGNPDDHYLVGHFTGAGRDALAFRRGNAFYFQKDGLDSSVTQVAVIHFGAGDSEDQYLVGDFTGSGRDALAVRRGNQIIYQTAGITSASSQVNAITFGAGNSEDQYLVGDFTGIGRDELAVRRGNEVIYQTHGITSSADEVASVIFGHGTAAEKYLVGDFTGVGHDVLALCDGNEITYEKGVLTDAQSIGKIRFAVASPSNDKESGKGK